MNAVHRLFFMALTCLSVTAVHGEKQYVTAKKAHRTDRQRIGVSILESDGKTIISEDSFVQSSRKNKLYFDFTKGENEVRVYKGGINGTRLSEMKVSEELAPVGSKIIIDNNGEASIGQK